MLTTSILLGGLLSVSPASADTALSLPRQTLTLGSGYAAPEASPIGPSLAVTAVSSSEPVSPAELSPEALDAISRGQSVYEFGEKGLMTGGILIGSGLAMALVGSITALSGGDGVILLTGMVVSSVGGAVVAASVPVMFVGGRIASGALQSAGIPLSSTPRLLALGGVGLMAGGIAGLILVDEPIVSVMLSRAVPVGGALVVAGAIMQMREVRQAFEAYHQQGTSWIVTPMLSEDARGAALTVRF